MLPWIKATYPEGNFVFQQDGASAHSTTAIQAKLTEELGGPDHCWRKEMWTPQSPDLNPLDYGVWSVLQDDVQADSHPNLESLKARIVAAWEALEAAFIVKTCKSFRPASRPSSPPTAVTFSEQPSEGCVSWSLVTVLICC